MAIFMFYSTQSAIKQTDGKKKILRNYKFIAIFFVTLQPVTEKVDSEFTKLYTNI